MTTTSLHDAMGFNILMSVQPNFGQGCSVD